MAYGELENRILRASMKNPIDLSEIQNLFDQGADPNAVDDWNEDEQKYEETLFTGCIFETPWDGENLYPLLECFIKNGLDVQRQAELLLKDLIYVGPNSSRIKMAQLILEHLPNRIDMTHVLETVAGEESFYRCCGSNTDFVDDDREAEDLRCFYEFLDAYAMAEDPTEICPG